MPHESPDRASIDDARGVDKLARPIASSGVARYDTPMTTDWALTLRQALE
jgi:hypothetical protein